MLFPIFRHFTHLHVLPQSTSASLHRQSSYTWQKLELPVKLLEKEANMRINSLVILLQLSCSKGLKNMSHQLPNATPVAMRIKQKQYFRKFKINCCEQVSAMDGIGSKLINKRKSLGLFAFKQLATCQQLIWQQVLMYVALFLLNPLVISEIF